jgi:hypothetical protein
MQKFAPLSLKGTESLDIQTSFWHGSIDQIIGEEMLMVLKMFRGSNEFTFITDVLTRLCKNTPIDSVC